MFRIERVRINKRMGQRERKVAYGITGLSPEQADARRLAAIVRGHWGIENRLPWLRDKEKTLCKSHSI